MTRAAPVPAVLAVRVREGAPDSVHRQTGANIQVVPQRRVLTVLSCAENPSNVHRAVAWNGC